MAVNTLMNRRNLGTAKTSRGLSPNIWSNFPVASILADSGEGIFEFQDFLTGGKITVPTTHAALVGLPISGFGSAGSTIAYGNTAYGSAVTATPVQDAGTLVLSETTTREAVAIRSDVMPYRISKNFGMMCFECRFKMALTATNENAFFIGLLGTDDLTASIPIIAAAVDTHLIASKNLVGFKKPVADTTTFDTIYRADGIAAVVLGDGMGALVNDTYLTVGFLFDPFDNYLRYYINNVEQVDKFLVPDNTGTDFPADVNMGWVVAMSVGTAESDNSLTCDWVASGQVFNTNA